MKGNASVDVEGAECPGGAEYPDGGEHLGGGERLAGAGHPGGVEHLDRFLPMKVARLKVERLL